MEILPVYCSSKDIHLGLPYLSMPLGSWDKCAMVEKKGAAGLVEVRVERWDLLRRSTKAFWSSYSSGSHFGNTCICWTSRRFQSFPASTPNTYELNKWYIY